MLRRHGASCCYNEYKYNPVSSLHPKSLFVSSDRGILVLVIVIPAFPVAFAQLLLPCLPPASVLGPMFWCPACLAVADYVVYQNFENVALD